MSDVVRLMIGAMSGTSADGVDAALVRIEGRGLDMRAQLIRHHHRAYPPELGQEVFRFRGGDASANLARLCQLGREISLIYALTVNELLSAEGISADKISAVAAHGQTLYHAPPLTLQWLDPSLIAAEVGCAVVSDFRRADLAAGGQGAPLVPFADYAIFRHPTKDRVLLNIGGIANITIIPAGASIEQLIAFDTGPGNCISDWLMRRENPEGPAFDFNGEYADRGKVLSLARDALKDDFFEKPPPKSTDGPEMIRIFESAMVRDRQYSAEDLLATACFFTASSIEHGIGLVAPFLADDIELIVSGGGTQNRVIMGWLRELLSKSTIQTVDVFGIPAEAKEAVAFALLGAATLDGIPSNVPPATGAKRGVVLGSITPRN